jgi:hypothetical protein
VRRGVGVTRGTLRNTLHKYSAGLENFRDPCSGAFFAYSIRARLSPEISPFGFAGNILFKPTATWSLYCLSTRPYSGNVQTGLRCCALLRHMRLYLPNLVRVFAEWS